ncbi:MAG: hypothetical protein HYY06_32020 [Deltaproteobacteria bacterium]|nr:hypothetical protein [Deltaproteobacteria bacterium]
MGILPVSPAAAHDASPRIVVVGGDAAVAVADASRVELDPLGFDVRVQREAAVEGTRLDLRARAGALERAAARAGAMGAAEVLLREDGAALLLYHSRVDGVTRSRALPVSRPPTDQDFRPNRGHAPPRQVGDITAFPGSTARFVAGGYSRPYFLRR